MSKSLESVDLNEYVLNYMEHTHLFIRRFPSGEIAPVYTRDISGRLIFTPDPECGVQNYAYTANSVTLKAKDQSFMPMPWHLTSEEFSWHLRNFIDNAPHGLYKELISVYPDYEPPRVDTLHCPYTENPMPRESALAIIDALENPAANEDLLVDARIKLQYSGIFQIPVIGTYAPKYHVAFHGNPIEGDPVTTIYNGWASAEEVLRPSEVVPDS